MKVVKRS